MRKHACIYSLAVLAATLLWMAEPLRADVTGTILGTVTDPSGAAVPGAAVTLNNPNTGLARKATTGSTGVYEFLVVPVGENYVVEVSAAGFQKATQTGITLLVNQKFRADFQLVVGAVTQTVNVSAELAQVETTSTQLGDVIEDRKMTGLPLNGRSYIDLLGLQAGVVPITSGVQVTDRTPPAGGKAGYFSVNGSREAANAFLVNGGDVEEGRNNGASVVPTLDSIQEFRLLTNSFDAEYGRFSGGVVNAITKSGTNQFHGTAFDFLRNDKLDARNFFDVNQSNPTTGQELPGTARGALKRNQFGGAGGGPILKNRLFFFGDYQGTREVRGVSTGTVSVPSLAERGGDFSDVSVTGFPPITGLVRGDNVPGNGTMDEVLSERLGYTVTDGEPYWFDGCTTTAQCVFPNQMIPQSAWGPVAKATLKFIPNPIASPGGSPIFSTSAEKATVRDDKWALRLDLNNQRTGNWSFYYHYDQASSLDPFPEASVPGFPAVTLQRAQQFNMANTRNFGASAVNEARINFTRMGLHLDKPAGGLGKITDFGFMTGGLGINPVDPGPLYEGMPPTTLDLLGIDIGLPSLSTGQFNNTYQALDNFSKIIGKHTLKLGGEFRFLQINERNVCAPNGSFDFGGSETGNDFADYLLGAPDGAVQCSNQYLDSRSKYGGTYAQDAFKVRPNLTLNYGLRWEFSQPYYDTQGKIQAFVPGQQSTVYPDAPTGWLFPGDRGIPKTLSPTDYNNFAPRVGFAYSPGFSEGALGKIFGGPGKTSIRGAFGIYYTAIEDLTLFYEVGDAPFGLYFPIPGLVYLEEPYKARNTSNDPGQRFPFTIPKPGATGIWPQFLPITGSPGFKTDNVLPYVEHINLSIQREISNSTVLTVGFVGTRGHHLIAQVEFNPGIASRCLQIPGCGRFGEDTIYDLNGDGVYTLGVDAFGTRPYSITSGLYAAQGLLDFSSNTYEATMANSNYNALQVSLEKKVGALRFLGAYTWSKSLDNASGFNDTINTFNYRISKALSSYDMTHNFVTSYSYDLPFQKLTSSTSGALQKFLSGWQVTGITRFTTGLAMPLRASGDRSLCGCGGVDRPNYNGQPIQFFDPRASANHQYFSPSPFSQEVTGIAGNANRRFFHGPGLNYWDFALHKTTRVTERTSIEFRAEFFNLFNHAQFFNPSGNVSSSRFGRVTDAREPRIGQLALKFYF